MPDRRLGEIERGAVGIWAGAGVVPVEHVFAELAETTIGLYKTECTREDSPFRNGPLETLADLEEITSAWVHWYNTSRLMHRLGRRPPAEAEAEYYDHHRAGHPDTAHT
jgi:Integrase core domain